MQSAERVSTDGVAGTSAAEPDTTQVIDEQRDERAEREGDEDAGTLEPTRGAGPLQPPAELWTPAAGKTPATGNFVYFEPEAGESIVGVPRLYTRLDAVISVEHEANEHGYSSGIPIRVSGSEDWWVTFYGRRGDRHVIPGYYELGHAPRWENPDLLWTLPSGEDVCDARWGWVYLQHLAFDGDVLTELDARFEYRCAQEPALRGQIHFRSSDTSEPTGPVDPPPSELWAAEPSALPTSGNYVYLESEPGDLVGGGETFVLADGLMVEAIDNHIAFWVERDDERWMGSVLGRPYDAQLAPGYYGDLGVGSDMNRAFGGLRWSRRDGFCQGGSGWFAVDHIVYAGDQLTELDLRFEQRCSHDAPALRGQVHLRP